MFQRADKAERRIGEVEGEVERLTGQMEWMKEKLKEAEKCTNTQVREDLPSL